MNKTRKPSKWANTTREVIETVAGSGCIAHPVFMLGWPGDTAYKTEKLVEFVGEISSCSRVQPFVAFTTPHPGSRLWHQREALGLKVITSDLSRFIHFYPVALPLSMGDNALQILVDAHNRIRIETKMINRNPTIDLNFVLAYADLL